MNSKAYPTIKVFISYSHEDDMYMKDLETHLSTLKRQGIISSWTDRCIIPGTVFKEEIDSKMDESSIILLLISPSFINSDYCYNIEMKKAIERHGNRDAVVIPIIIRPTYLEDTEFMKLQALPTNAKPISTWGNKDEAFLDVVQGIRKSIKYLLEEYLKPNKKKV